MFDEPLFAAGPRWAWVLLTSATLALVVFIALASPRVDPPIWPDAARYLYLPGIGFAAAGLTLHHQAVGRLAMAAGVAAISVSANLHWPGHHLLLGAVPAYAAVIAVPVSLLNNWGREQFNRCYLWSIAGTLVALGVSSAVFPL